MVVQSGQRAAYASTSSVKAVIEKHRHVRLASIDASALTRIGVGESLIPRTLQAMPLLGFYDEHGQITPAFDALHKAIDEDFKPKLADLLREAYAEVLAFVGDPATATPQQIENAFRGFVPTGQLGRMVQLFIGLFTYAEVRSPEATPRRSTGGGSRPSQGPVKPKTAAPTNGQVAARTQDGEPPPPPPPPTPPPQMQGQQVDVAFGSAGQVTLFVDVRWLDLPEKTFVALRKAIEEIKALGYQDPAPSSTGAVNGEMLGERVS